MNELPSNIYQEISTLSSEGDSLAESLQYEAAIKKYNEAWKLVPEPKSDWEASTWLMAAIGDACFLSCYFTSGAEAFTYATVCPSGLGNPFIHLRLGQCELENGNHDLAVEHLLRAYAIEGSEIFASEAAKYFDYLKSNVEPPVSGKW